VSCWRSSRGSPTTRRDLALLEFRGPQQQAGRGLKGPAAGGATAAHTCRGSQPARPIAPGALHQRRAGTGPGGLERLKTAGAEQRRNSRRSPWLGKQRRRGLRLRAGLERFEQRCRTSSGRRRFASRCFLAPPDAAAHQNIPHPRQRREVLQQRPRSLSLVSPAQPHLMGPCCHLGQHASRGAPSRLGPAGMEGVNFQLVRGSGPCRPETANASHCLLGRVGVDPEQGQWPWSDQQVLSQTTIHEGGAVGRAGPHCLQMPSRGAVRCFKD